MSYTPDDVLSTRVTVEDVTALLEDDGDDFTPPQGDDTDILGDDVISPHDEVTAILGHLFMALHIIVLYEGV